MAAVPLALKRSIGVGIGLFILFIGFVNGGLIVTPQGASPIVTLAFPTQTGAVRLPARPADHRSRCTSSRSARR
jgi:xanthine/uracil/vitamin C permease (AzgA family)